MNPMPVSSRHSATFWGGSTICAPSASSLVPPVSTSPMRSGTSTLVANSRMMRAAAAISPIVSFLTRNPTSTPAICTGESSPLISRRQSESISSWKISR